MTSQMSTALLALALTATLPAQNDTSQARMLYYEAFHAETAEADWHRAADLYRRVIASDDIGAELRERAQRRLENCERRLGKVDAKDDAQAAATRQIKDHVAVFRQQGASAGASCKACHSPHSRTAAPAWAAAAGARQVLDDVSALCAGCHDGFVSARCIGGASTDLHHHPVGIPYGGEVDAGLKLFNQRIECATCHFSHGAEGSTGEPFLRRPHQGSMFESQLCTTCHQTPSKPVLVYPAAPDKPRLQHLATFVGAGGSPFREARVPTTRRLAIGRPEPLTPYGLALHDGRLLLCCDDTDGVVVRDLDAPTPATTLAAGRVTEPHNIAVTGDSLIVTGGRGSVFALGGDGAVQWAQTSVGERLHGLCVHGDHVYVTGSGPGQVEVFDRTTGERRTPVRLTGVTANVFDLAADPAGNLLIADTADAQVKRFSPAGELLQEIGADRLARPKGVACDRDGRVFVVDAGYGEVSVFAPDGELLLSFGRRSEASDDGLRHPAQIAIDYDHVDRFADRAATGWRVDFVIAVSNQVGPRTVEVYGFLDPSTTPDQPEPAQQPGDGEPAPPDPLLAAGEAHRLLSAHPTFRARNCTACHGKHVPTEVGGATADHDAWASCLNCHAAGKAAPMKHRGNPACKHIHADGSCKDCHLPHTSAEPALLKMTLVGSKLCLSCHEK